MTSLLEHESKDQLESKDIYDSKYLIEVSPSLRSLRSNEAPSFKNVVASDQLIANSFNDSAFMYKSDDGEFRSSIRIRFSEDI